VSIFAPATPREREENFESYWIPSKLDVLAILPFGYPADKIGRGKKNRKPLKTVAHRERYGQPFE
jgi:nitroreductase